MDTDQIFSTVFVVVGLIVTVCICIVVAENRREQRRRDSMRAFVAQYHRKRLLVAPHRPSALFAEKGWRASCGLDGCIDRDAWLIHERPEEALDEACDLLLESIHGPRETRR